jgi:hypothetical protein
MLQPRSPPSAAGDQAHENIPMIEHLQLGSVKVERRDRRVSKYGTRWLYPLSGMRLLFKLALWPKPEHKPNLIFSSHFLLP